MRIVQYLLKEVEKGWREKNCAINRVHLWKNCLKQKEINCPKMQKSLKERTKIWRRKELTITVDSKVIPSMFFWKPLDTFLIHQRTIYKKKIWRKEFVQYSFLFSKNEQYCFWSVQGQNNFYLFHIIFNFKKNQRIHSPLS